MTDITKNTVSLKSNTVANFIGLGYATVIGIVVYPLYLQYLGAQAFGLIGFFMVFQAWMQLFDMGMSPLLSRQAALANAQSTGFLELKKILRSLEVVFVFISLGVVLSLVASSTWIASNWLNVSSLALQDVAVCIMLMGVMTGMRFFSALYRSGLQGMEKQIQLNIANTALVTLKFAGSVLLLQFVTQNYVDFFVYQLVIGVVELVVLAFMFYHGMPATERVGVRIFWKVLRPVLPFASSMAYATVVWIVVTQLDKALLSSVLTLTEFGYFSLIVIIGTAIAQISMPVSHAILPRMTYLLSQQNEQQMLVLYRKSTQILSVIIFPITGVIAMYPVEVVYLWTGDRQAAEWAGPILFWYALGNGVLVISAFQYYLQFAHGKLRMHVIYNTLSACIQIPLIIYAACQWGASGVAITWFMIRLVSFVVWTPIVHYKFARGIHNVWLFKDIMPFFISTTALLMMTGFIEINFLELNRSGVFVCLLGIGITALVINVLISPDSRKLVTDIVKTRIKA